MPINDPDSPPDDLISPVPDPPNLIPLPPDNLVSPGELPFLSDESPMKASVKDHKAQVKKGSGKRNEAVNDHPKNGVSNALLAPEKPPQLPSPKFQMFKTSAPNPAQDSRRFYNFWNELPGWARDRTQLYVYRTWPVLLPIPEDAKEKEFSYIDKISGSEPLQVDEDLLHRYGCGIYKLMFNEQVPTGRNVCTIYVTVGGHDLKSNPPSDRRISDVNQVDLTHPENKSYVEFLRMTGKLPEQQKGKELEAEMAIAQLVDRQANRIDALTDKAIEAAMAKSKGTGEPVGEAVDRAIGVVADAAQRSNQMLADAYREIRETKGGGDNDTFKMALELAEKLTAGRGDGGTSEEVRELRKQVADMQTARMDALERQLSESKSAPGNTGNPFDYAKSGLSAIKEMKAFVDEMNPKPSAIDEAADAAGVPAWVMPAINYGLPILGNIVSMVGMRMGFIPVPTQSAPQPIPNPQQPVQPYPPPSQPSNVTQMGQPGIGAPAQSSQQPIPSGIQTYGLPVDVAELLYEIKTPLAGYLASGASGKDYADIFMGNYGEEVFKQVTAFGAEGLLNSIVSFPPITDRLNVLKVGEDRLRAFVADFVAFDPASVEEGDGDGDGNGVDGKGAA